MLQEGAAQQSYLETLLGNTASAPFEKMTEAKKMSRRRIYHDRSLSRGIVAA